VSWREIEFEVASGDTDRLAALDSRLRALGLRRAKSKSKLARVLDGVSAPAPVTAVKGKRAAKATAGDVVLAYVSAQVEQILVNDPQVRLDVAGSVHRMRVATRRLRSALQTFKPVVSAGVVRPLRAELKWLATELGRARDAEVLRDRLQSAVAEEDQRAVSGPVGQTIDETMSESYRAAHKGLLGSLDSQRYHALVQALDGLRTEPPLTAKAARPAAKVLPQRAARAYGRLSDLVNAIHDTPPGEERDTHLHEARKAAKKARYAGETLAEFFGKPASAFATAMESLQEELGEHQDSVVMRARLADLAGRETSPAAAFTYGRLHAEQQHRGDLAVQRFEEEWQAASQKSLRRWLA
jgi:CHAD domain-containing protein